MTNDKLAAIVTIPESGVALKAATVLAAAAIGGAIWAVVKDDDNGNPDWRINNGIRNEPTPDTTINAPSITINDVADIKKSAVADSYTISGSLNNVDSDATATVWVSLNGKDAKQATVNGNTWTLIVSGSELSAQEGANAVVATVTATDTAGNVAAGVQAATDNFTVTNDLLNEPTITVHSIAPIATASGETTISGSLNLNNEDLTSEKVTVVIGGKSYPAVISADKQSWRAKVPNSDLVKSTGEIEAKVEIAKDAKTADALSTEQEIVPDAANPNNNVKTFEIDKTINTPTITIKDVADIEQASVADKYTLSGSLNNIDADVTSTVVTVNVNGTDKTATVSSDKKSWTLDVAGSELASAVGTDLKVTATVKVTDAVGNTATSSANDTYNVTAKPVTPSITIDAIASDEVALLNQFFGTQNKTISGKLADIPTGATPTVAVTVAGKAYTATVSGSTWSIAVPKSELTERGAKNVVAKLTVNGASDEANATFYVIDPTITIDNQGIHITQDNLNGTTTLTGTYDVEGADTRKVLVQIGIGSGASLATVVKEYSSDDTTNPVVLNEDNNTWSITVSNKDLAFQVGDMNTLQVGAKVEFTEGSQNGDKYKGLGYTSDVVAPKASPLVLDLVDEEMPVTSYVLGKTTEVDSDDSVSGNDDVADTFVFSKMLDGGIATIAHFDVNQDRVQLSSEVFTSLSNTMSDFADYVQYDAATGVLSYDADGTGAGAAVPFAQLDKDLPIEQNHFIIG